MNSIEIHRRTPGLPEMYEVLERIGRMAERGLSIARRYTDEVPLPVPPVVVPSVYAAASLNMEDASGEMVASWTEAREAVHQSVAPIIDAAFKVVTNWGYALWCMAENIPVESLPEALAKAETDVAAAIVELESAAEACQYQPAVIRPGMDRIAALVGERGMTGARELLRDLLSYVSSQDSPADFAVKGVAQWDQKTGEETGEMWLSPPDMDAAALLAAIRIQVLSRYDGEDVQGAWDDIERRAADSVEWHFRAFAETP